MAVQFFLLIWREHCFAPLMIHCWSTSYAPLKEKEKYVRLILVRRNFFLVAPGSLCLNKSSKYYIFSYTAWGFYLIQRLKAKPSVSLKIAPTFCATFWKLPNLGGLQNFGSRQQLWYSRLPIATAQCLFYSNYIEGMKKIQKNKNL